MEGGKWRTEKPKWQGETFGTCSLRLKWSNQNRRYRILWMNAERMWVFYPTTNSTLLGEWKDFSSWHGYLHDTSTGGQCCYDCIESYFFYFTMPSLCYHKSITIHTDTPSWVELSLAENRIHNRAEYKQTYRVKPNTPPGHPRRHTHRELSIVPILFIPILKDIF